MDYTHLSWAEQQVDHNNYIKWLQAAQDFDPSTYEAEVKKYKSVTPEEFGGRGDYLGVCEHCGK